MRTYVRVSIKGSPYKWFTDALDRRDLAGALSESKGMRLGLADALSLVILMIEQRDPRCERWAAWWVARLITERRTVTLAGVDQAVVALVSLLDAEEEASQRMVALCDALELRNVRGLD